MKVTDGMSRKGSTDRPATEALLTLIEIEGQRSEQRAFERQPIESIDPSSNGQVAGTNSSILSFMHDHDHFPKIEWSFQDASIEFTLTTKNQSNRKKRQEGIANHLVVSRNKILRGTRLRTKTDKSCIYSIVSAVSSTTTLPKIFLPSAGKHKANENEANPRQLIRAKAYVSHLCSLVSVS